MSMIALWQMGSMINGNVIETYQSTHGTNRPANHLMGGVPYEVGPRKHLAKFC